jgi:transcription antitermination protein NusB
MAAHAHSPNGRDDRSARSVARLAAVQAIYQMELTGADAEAVALEFIEHRFAGGPETALAAPDEAFFGEIVRGVPHHQVEIDRSVAECLSKDWKLKRIDSILRAILRAATYELIAQKDVPAKVVIDEYLDVAHAFFAGEEAAFVNAVLDRLARRKRAAEFGEVPPDDEPQF